MWQPEKRDGGDYRIVLGRGWRAVVCGSLKTQFSEANILFIVLRLTFVMHLPLHLIAARATFFASPKKVSKERRPRRAGSLRELPSLRILFSARAN